MTDNTMQPSIEEIIRQSEEMIADAEQQIDAMQRLCSKTGISREACRRYLESDLVAPEQKKKVSEELTKLKEELEAERQRSGDDDSNKPSSIKMGSGVLPV